MITLGINAAFHDSAAALVVDGVIVAAAEEERFTRIKHGKRPVPFSAWELPFNAIDYCLAEAGVTLADVDHVAYSFDPREFLGERVADDAATIALAAASRRAHDRGAWESPWDPLFARLRRQRAAPARRRRAAPPARALRRRRSRRPPFRWHFVDHHLCHQASAFLAAPFDALRGDDARRPRRARDDDATAPARRATAIAALGAVHDAAFARPALRAGDAPSRLPALERRVQGDGAGRARHADAIARRCATKCTSASDGQYAIAPLDAEALFGPARGARRAARAAPSRPRRIAAGRARGDRARARRAGCARRAANATSPWPAASRSTA